MAVLRLQDVIDTGNSATIRPEAVSSGQEPEHMKASNNSLCPSVALMQKSLLSGTVALPGHNLTQAEHKNVSESEEISLCAAFFDSANLLDSCVQVD